MSQLSKLQKHIEMAAGRQPADLCIRNVHICNVFSGRIMKNATVRVGDGIFLGFAEGPALEYMDGEGQYLAPGFMDAHVHIESSMLCPEQFARLVLPLGTTTVIADPHEIANVLGTEGLRYMLESSAHLPLDVRIMLPSCVPATPFEHAGATLGAEELAPFMSHPRVGGLGEMMNYPGVIQADTDVLQKILLAAEYGKPCDGHAPAVKGTHLDAYTCAGIITDHECSTVEEMQENLDRGMYVAIRQGSAARNLVDLVQGVTPQNAHRCLLCTDDRHPGDIIQNGHINYLLRLCVEQGLDPLLSMRMASLNVAQCYGLKNKGAIAPGYAADFILLPDLRKFLPRAVYVSGQKVADKGKLSIAVPTNTPAFVTSTVRPAPLQEEQLALHLPTGKARIIGLQPHSIVSLALEGTVQTTNGFFDAVLNPHITKIAVIERHKASGHVGIGLMQGYIEEGKSMGGAIATTIAHDSHNIVVAGDSDADMLAAVEDLCRIGGGITLVRQGKVLDHLSLPVAGLMSDRSAEEVHASVDKLLSLARDKFGISPTIEPFMTLSFMALPVIPELKLTDAGLFDVRSFSFVTTSVE